VAETIHYYSTSSTGTFYAKAVPPSTSPWSSGLYAMTETGGTQWFSTTGISSTVNDYAVYAQGSSVASSTDTCKGAIEINQTRTADLPANNGSDFSAMPWNSSWDAEVQSEVADALAAESLDELDVDAINRLAGGGERPVGFVYMDESS